MEGSKGSGEAGKPSPDPSPNPNPPAASGDDASAAAAAVGSRRPFTSLNQVDADLALARVLQEQEQAYMMLRMNSGEGSEYGSSEAGSYEYGEDDEDYEEELQRLHRRVGHHEPPTEGGEGCEYGEDALEEDEEVGDAEPDVDPSAYEDDEAYARALQDAEEREVAARLMALTGLRDWRAMEQEQEQEEEEEEGEDEHENDPQIQDAWPDVDEDEYSYEELVALGDVVGTESRGLSADTLSSLPSVTYKAQDMQDGNMEQCVICRVEFEEGESLVALPCKHSYHSECINQWLHINKVCPMCGAEVSASDNKRA